MTLGVLLIHVAEKIKIQIKTNPVNKVLLLNADVISFVASIF